MAVGDSDVVAEDFVVADFEGGNIGIGDQLRLIFGQPLLAGVRDSAEAIQFGIVGIGNHIAVAQVGWWVGADGAGEKFGLFGGEIAEGEELGGDIFSALEFLQLVEQAGD